ncbi:hypothetical protein CMI37_23745 [Candidatus Pacearchaeota archaeon]|nr:hypothetical protein [Candidatus Pacearchaeota archaeon]
MIARRLKANYNTRLKIILKFCKNPAKINWEQEMRIAGLLIDEYGQEVFVKLSFEFLSFEMESLAQFQSKKFRAFLEKQKRLFKLDFTKERAIIGKQKIGKDKTIKRKPKTLLNFLNYDSKKENKTTG